MNIIYHPKYRGIKRDELPEQISKWKVEPLTEEERLNLVERLSNAPGPIPRTKYSSFIHRLYEDDKKLYKKFYFYTRQPYLFNRYEPVLSALQFNTVCERCQSCYTTERNRGICGLCERENPEAVKKLRYSRATQKHIQDHGTEKYGTRNPWRPADITWTAKQWTDKDREVLKSVAPHIIESGKSNSQDTIRVCEALYKASKTTWKRFFYYQKRTKLGVPQSIRLAYHGKVCGSCSAAFVASNNDWGCRSCQAENPDLSKLRSSKAGELSRRAYREKTGYSHPMHNPEVKAKVQDSWTPERYKERQTKTRATNLRRYGTEHAMKSDEVRAKVSRTWRSKTKEQLQDLRRKKIATNLERYGSAAPMGNAAVQERARASYEEKTGYQHNMQNPDSLKLRAERSLERWGTDHPNKHPAVKKRIVATSVERYGGIAKGSVEVRAKIEHTCIERYGFPIATMNPEIMDKCKATWTKIYGHSNPNLNPEQAGRVLKNAMNREDLEIQGRHFTVQGRNEARYLRYLVSKYGVDNVHTQFSSAYKKRKIAQKCGFIPDFLILRGGKRRIIELKSEWTLFGRPETLSRNIEKAVKAPNVRWVVGYRNQFLTLPADWYLSPNLSYLIHRLYCEKVGRSTELVVSLSKYLTGWTIHGHDIMSQERKVVVRCMDSYFDSEANPDREPRPSYPGYRIVHVWDYQWRRHKSAVRQLLLNLSGSSRTTVFARKCEVRSFRLNDEVRTFYQRNHVQGAPRSGLVYALYSDEKLVAAMTFGHRVSSRGSKKQTGHYELIRYATSCNVPGGASRLLTAFVRTNAPKQIISYSDSSMFDGGMYETLGFVKEREYRSDYKIIWNLMRLDVRPKQSVTRAALSELVGFDPELTERQNCTNLQLFRLPQQGKVRWALQFNT